MFKPLITPRDIAEQYNRMMPENVRQHLKGRGIHAAFIDRHLLGWDGERITIPVFGPSTHEVLGFRHAGLPDDPAQKPKVVSEESVKAELYGRETLARTPHRVVVCEDEFDRLVLESRSFTAVAVGEGIRPEWIPWFQGIEDVFICLHRGRAAEKAAKKIQKALPQARLARLPSDVGEGGSVSDFFVKLMRTERDFELVLAAGVTASGDSSEEQSQVRVIRSADKSQQRRAEQIRKRVPLHEVVSLFINLQASGGRLVGHCPFRDDSSRSFAVYPPTDTYRCSRCGAEGEVVRFLMDKESITFGQALEYLERFEITHELYGTS